MSPCLIRLSAVAALACTSLARAQVSPSANLDVVTFNIYSPGFECPVDCIDAKLSAIADTILDTAADIVMLQEVDDANSVVDDRHILSELEALLEAKTARHWYSSFGVACKKNAGWFGNALLSTSPIWASQSFPLGISNSTSTECDPDHNPDTHYEPRAAMVAFTHRNTVVSTHFNYEKAHYDEEAEDLPSVISMQTGPVLVGGDLNAEDGIAQQIATNVANQYAEGGCFGTVGSTDTLAEIQCTLMSEPVSDTSTDDRTYQCDHLLGFGLWQHDRRLVGPAQAYLPRSFLGGNEPLASDHFAVGNRVTVPRPTSFVELNNVGGSASAFVVYDRYGGTSSHGRGEIYEVNRSGLIPRISSNNWRRSWHTITSGDFDGDGNADDLLFYDRQQGYAEIYRVDRTSPSQWQMNFMVSHSGWRTSWDIITPIRIPGQPQSGLLFYSRTGGNNGDGYGAVYRTYGAGQLGFLYENRGFRNNWNKILPGDFDRDWSEDDLLFYGDDSFHSFYSVRTDGGLTLLDENGNWDAWDEIVPVRFSDTTNPGIVFYSRDRALGMLYQIVGPGRMQLASVHGGWRSTWFGLVRGDWDRDSLRDDIMFYEGAEDGLFPYRIETTSASPILPQ